MPSDMVRQVSPRHVAPSVARVGGRGLSFTQPTSRTRLEVVHMRSGPVLLLAMIAAAACTSAATSGSESAPTQTDASPSPQAKGPSGFDNIQHVIYIVQENRSFDHYFGTFPGVEERALHRVRSGSGDAGVCVAIPPVAAGEFRRAAWRRGHGDRR